MSNWIKCADQMPTPRVRVLLCASDDGPVVGWLIGERIEHWSVDGQDDWDSLSYWTHWMPLPPLPQAAEIE